MPTPMIAFGGAIFTHAGVEGEVCASVVVTPTGKGIKSILHADAGLEMVALSLMSKLTKVAHRQFVKALSNAPVEPARFLNAFE